MDVECIMEQGRKGVSIIPETDFEIDFFRECFMNKNDRKVIIKSGSSLSDIMSIDVFIEG